MTSVQEPHTFSPTKVKELLQAVSKDIADIVVSLIPPRGGLRVHLLGVQFKDRTSRTFRDVTGVRLSDWASVRPDLFAWEDAKQHTLCLRDESQVEGAAASASAAAGSRKIVSLPRIIDKMIPAHNPGISCATLYQKIDKAVGGGLARRIGGDYSEAFATWLSNQPNFFFVQEGLVYRRTVATPPTALQPLALVPPPGGILI